MAKKRLLLQNSLIMKRLLYFVIVLTCANAYGQNPVSRYGYQGQPPQTNTNQRNSVFRTGSISGSINLQVSVPQGEYKEIGNKVGFGVRGNIMYAPSENSPFKLGADLGFLVNSSRRREFYFGSALFGSRYYVDASSNVFSIGIMARVEPLRSVKTALVAPFFEGVIGGNGFYASVDIDTGNGSSSSSSSRYNNNSSRTQWGLYYGGSVGLLMPVSNKISIEAKISYLIGGRTEYLTDPTIDANGYATFVSKTSETTMLIPQVGVKIGI